MNNTTTQSDKFKKVIHHQKASGTALGRGWFLRAHDDATSSKYLLNDFSFYINGLRSTQKFC